jgi:drug/metabolite transporter (DMT)-like permease
MLLILYSFFVFFLIASAFIVNKMIVAYVSPVLFVALRYFLSGVPLLIVFCRKKKVWAMAKENIFILIKIVVFTTFLPSLLRGYALVAISSSRAAFWGTFEPFVTAIYMYFLFGKKLTKLQVFSCLIGTFGAMFFIFTNPIAVGKFFSEEKYFSFYDLLQILSIVLSRYGWICAQSFLKKEGWFSPQQMNAFSFVLSSFLSFISGFIFYGKDFLENVNIDLKLILLFLYTIIIGNMLAYSLYADLLKRMNVTLVSLIGLSMPLFVHLLGPIVLNEKISPYFFISLVFIFIASYFFLKEEAALKKNKNV